MTNIILKTKKSKEERFGLSPEQYRSFEEDSVDTELLQDEMIPLTLKDGAEIKIKRQEFSKAVLQSKYNEYFKLRLKKI